METSKYSITPPQCENENISMEGKFLSTHEKTLNMIVCRITKSLAIWSWAPICTKSGRSERAGQGISGVIRQLLPRTYLLKFIFALNRGFLPWIFGAGLKSGSAYALVDLVSLAPLNWILTEPPKKLKKGWIKIVKIRPSGSWISQRHFWFIIDVKMTKFLK